MVDDVEIRMRYVDADVDDVDVHARHGAKAVA